MNAPNKLDQFVVRVRLSTRMVTNAFAKSPTNYTSFSDREIVIRLLGHAPGNC